MWSTHPDDAELVRCVTLEARPKGGPLGLPYTSKKLERFQMAVQRLILIHPRELEIPTVKDIDPVAMMEALPEDAKKVVQDAEVKKDVEEDKNVPEDVASDGQDTGKAPETEETENI